MKAYSLDLRERIVRFVEQGHSKAEAARFFNVCWRTVLRYCQKQEDGESLAPKPRPGRKKKFTDDALQQEVKAFPSATLKDYAKTLKASHVAVWKRLGKLKITRKKKR